MSFHTRETSEGYLIGPPNQYAEWAPIVPTFTALVDQLSAVPARFGRVKLGGGLALVFEEGEPTVKPFQIKPEQSGKVTVPLVEGCSIHALREALEAYHSEDNGHYVVSFESDSIVLTDPDYEQGERDPEPIVTAAQDVTVKQHIEAHAGGSRGRGKKNG